MEEKTTNTEEIFDVTEECSCNNHECDCGNHDCECDNHECNCEEDNKKRKHLNIRHKDEQLIKEINDLKDKIKDLENKNLMSSAELINYRKRKDEEVGRMLKYANEDIVLEILPILDNFERAIILDDENLNDELSQFLAGFKMIYAHLKNGLESFEVKAIDGNNKPFDPTYHQAVMTDHVDGMDPGMVIEVLQKGYLLKDKVIRPAMVRVSE